jgi:tetratricopeptide (TPR) repeat protein
MTLDYDQVGRSEPDPAARAKELIKQGIAHAEAGDADAALAALDEADRLAEKAGLDALVASARINKGFAHWVKGDLDTACGHFAEAAQIARAAEDTPRLASALGNLAAASRQAARWADAVTAYHEYIPLVADDPEALAGAHQDCGLAYLQLEQFEPALANLEEAERIAIEADLAELVISARINQGIVREREGEDELAVPHYEAAATLARESALTPLAAAAIERQAQALRQLSAFTEADPLFAEAEDLYRSLGKEDQLARTLHWHALAFKGAPQSSAPRPRTPRVACAVCSRCCWRTPGTPTPRSSSSTPARPPQSASASTASSPGSRLVARTCSRGRNAPPGEDE